LATLIDPATLIILSAQDYVLYPARKILFGVLYYILKSILTKLVQSRLLDICLIFVCMFMDLDPLSVYKQAKKNLANILQFSPQAWSIMIL